MKRKRRLRKANAAIAPSLSASANQVSDAVPPEDDHTTRHEQEQEQHSVADHRQPQYSKEELNLALEVVKQIMDMDGTAPFNLPVNPIMLGITDYFDVIDKPMDFGTVLRNLKDGDKYRNSEDVFNDVRHIWENCFRYNKPGDQILELVKKVKENFMMLWTAAGLYSAETRTMAEHISSPSPRETGRQRSRRLHGFPIGSVINSQQDQWGGIELQLQQHAHQRSSFEHHNSDQLNQSQPSSTEYHPSNSESDPDSDGSGPSRRQVETQGQGSSSKKRKPRGRGPTLCLDVWNMPEGEHVIVETNEVGQPDGDSASKLGNFLGTIARDGHLAPLTYGDWRAVPQEAKDTMLQLAKSKFDISPRLENWVLKTLGKRWKDWKAQLKAKYFSSKADDEPIEIDDERVLPKQRPILIAFWQSEESRKCAARNKANRARQTIAHTAGTKSFARIRKEERNKRLDGEDPTRAELFIVTHLHKDGTPVDETSANIITQLQERAQVNPPIASQEREIHNDIFSQVMGKDSHGRVRTYGLGPCPSDIWGPRPSRAEAIAIASEAKKALNEVAKMREKMEVVENKCVEMEVQMAEMKSALQKNPV